MAERIIELHDGERVVAVVPCCAAGPGWSNAPTWVHIVNYKTGIHREECIQPEERSEALNYIYYIGESVHAALYASVRTRPAKRRTRACKGGA